MGCGPLTAGFIAILNRIAGVRPNEIRFLGVVIEIDHTESWARRTNREH